jgi:hypothetical protein
VDRENVPAVMRTFDFANPDLSIPQRTETTVPQQALFGLNHPFVVQQAKALVKRMLRHPKSMTEARIERHLSPFVSTQPPQLTNWLLRWPSSQTDEQPVMTHPITPRPGSMAMASGMKSTGRVKTFTPLPHFTGSAWQGDEAWPNEKLGWAQLTAEGGHPGNDRKHAVVRRWIAPADGSYDVRSTLIHEPEVGDGIRAFVSHSRLGKLRSTMLLGSKADAESRRHRLPGG